MDIDLKNKKEADWGTWLTNIKKTATIYNAPPAFAQMRMPENVTLKTIYVTYFCDSCGAEEYMTIEPHDFHRIQEKIVCPVCSNVMYKAA